MTPHWLNLAPLIVLLVIAAVIDVRHRRIPNALTATLLIAGLVQAVFLPQMIGISPAQALLGAAVGFALTFVLFACGAMGGGDVKLVAAVGAWLGTAGVVQVVLVASVIGMGLALFQALLQGRLATVLRNTSALALSLIHVRQLGLAHARAMAIGAVTQDVEASEASSKLPARFRLPYAVPVALAVIAVAVMATGTA